MFRINLIFGLLLSSYCILASSNSQKEKWIFDSLRKQCKNIKKHVPATSLPIMITCKGTVVYQERQTKKRFRFDRDVIESYASITDSSDYYSSQPKNVNFAKGQKTVKTHEINTSHLTFYRIQMPEDGVGVHLFSCDQISFDNLEEVCLSHAKIYCKNNHYNPANSPADTSRLCTYEKISSLDLSKLYPEL